MIRFLRGRLVYKQGDAVILDVNGIGYRVTVPLSALPQLSLNHEVMLHTHLAVREDGMQLFGFQSRDELQTFEILIGVNGVGPRVGLAVLSVLSPPQVRNAILHGDSATLTRVPGVGKKLAQRLVVELKDKMAEEEGLPVDEIQAGAAPGTAGDAAAALEALGYKQVAARQVISEVLRDKGEGLDLNSLLKEALRRLAPVD